MLIIIVKLSQYYFNFIIHCIGQNLPELPPGQPDLEEQTPSNVNLLHQCMIRKLKAARKLRKLQTAWRMSVSLHVAGFV